MTTEEYEISEILHKMFCHSNHTDQCEWYYFSGDPTEYDLESENNKYQARYRFGNRACKLLRSFDFHTVKVFLDLIR